jgi:hypothetical protein
MGREIEIKVHLKQGSNKFMSNYMLMRQDITDATI